MRINKRLIQHSKCKTNLLTNNNARIVTDFLNNVLSGLVDFVTYVGTKIGELVVAVVDGIKKEASEIVHEFKMLPIYQAEDRELFSQLPSLRRFEHDMR